MQPRATLAAEPMPTQNHFVGDDNAEDYDHDDLQSWYDEKKPTGQPWETKAGRGKNHPKTPSDEHILVSVVEPDGKVIVRGKQCAPTTTVDHIRQLPELAAWKLRLYFHFESKPVKFTDSMGELLAISQEASMLKQITLTLFVLSLIHI